MIHVLGSINIDYSCTVDHLPAAGETTIGSGLALTPGGKGANQALAARRAGAAVKMTGAIGTDDVAKQALSLMQRDAVDLSDVATVPGPTGCAFVFVDAQSENQIIIIPGANACVSQQQAENLAINPVDLLLLQLEVPLPVVVAAAKKAQQRNATVLANLAPYQTLNREFFEAVDILLVNETEALQLAGDFSIDTSRNIAGNIAEALKTTVVLTRGAKGVAVVDCHGLAFEIPGIAINALDSVGAGDTFAGYLGAMLAQGKQLKDACEIANKAAALACTKPGAQSAIPGIVELELAARQ